MVTAWPLLLLAGGPQAVLIPILLTRSAASVVQTVWNHRLDKAQPLTPRSGFEWAMLALGMVFCLAFVAVQETELAAPEWALLAGVMAPFSAAQVGAARRSQAMHEGLASGVRVLTMRSSLERRRWHAKPTEREVGLRAA
jgi:cobalamin biosynthesis protein CobD/CbiB